MFEAGIRRHLAQQEGQRVIMPKDTVVQFGEGMAEMQKHVHQFMVDWNEVVGQPEWESISIVTYTRWGGAIGRIALCHEAFLDKWGLVFEYRYQKATNPENSFFMTMPDSTGRYLHGTTIGTIIDDWLHNALREGLIGPYGRYISKLDFRR